MQHTGTYLTKQKSIIKEDACMKFYEKTHPLYFEMDLSGFALEAALLQTRSSKTSGRDGTSKQWHNSDPLYLQARACEAQKKRYSNTEREAPGILYGLKNSTIATL